MKTEATTIEMLQAYKDEFTYLLRFDPEFQYSEDEFQSWLLNDFGIKIGSSEYESIYFYAKPLKNGAPAKARRFSVIETFADGSELCVGWINGSQYLKSSSELRELGYSRYESKITNN